MAKKKSKAPKRKASKKSKRKVVKTPKRKKPASKTPKRKPLLKSGPKSKSKPQKSKSKTHKKLSRAAKAHVAKKPPRGFVDIVKQQTKSEAFEKIKQRLEDARDVLASVSELDSRVRVHVYKDGSIDGELLVKVPRGTSSDDVALKMGSAAGRAGMSGFWINMGTRFTIEEDDFIYRKFNGMNDVNTHYQAAVPANWSEIPLIVRKVIIAGMEKKYGRKADSVYLRIHWSPGGKKPKSRG